jgi:hypothetical protein
MDLNFMGIMAEAAEAAGYEVTDLKEERYASDAGGARDAGIHETGAIIVRLMPKTSHPEAET